MLRILFDGRRARHCRRGAAQKITIAAREVVVSAVRHSFAGCAAALGLGPAEIARLGIASLPTAAASGATCKITRSCISPAAQAGHARRHAPAITSCRSCGFRPAFKVAAPGIFFTTIPGGSHEVFGPRMALVATAFTRPCRAASVELRSPDPEVSPQVEQRLLVRSARRAPYDLAGTAWRSAAARIEAVRQGWDELYLMPRRPPLKLINGTGLTGALKSFGAAAVLGAPAPLRRAIIAEAIAPGRLISDGWQASQITDNETSPIGRDVSPELDLHYGRAGEPQRRGRPHMAPCRHRRAARGRRLGDAGVVSANTNLTVVMIAERVAEFMRRQG